MRRKTRDIPGRKRHYTATAVQGFWLSAADGKMYGTLNEHNKSLNIGGAENAWKAWHYDDPASGKRRPLFELRDQSTMSAAVRNTARI